MSSGRVWLLMTLSAPMKTRFQKPRIAGVAEDGRPYVGEDVELTVTSSMQTSAGKLIFGRIGGEQREGPATEPEQPAPKRAPVQRQPSPSARNPRR